MCLSEQFAFVLYIINREYMYQLLQKRNYEITKILNYTSNNWILKIVSYYTQVKICSIERDQGAHS